MTYYIIGQRSPKGATDESQITHYKVATSIEDAKDGKGKVLSKDVFVKLAQVGDNTIMAYNHRNGKTWELTITI